jgi:hypothetical protein
MKPLASLLISACTVLLVSAVAPVYAQVVFSTDFNSASTFDSNFVKLPASGASTLGWITNAGGLVRKTGTGSQSVIFDTSATGGTNGSGGTAGSKTNNNYGDVLVSSTFRLSTNTPSMGYWARVNDAYNSGYLGLIDFRSTNEVRFRIYEGGNPTSGSAGTSLVSVTVTNNVSPLSFSSYYTGTFDLKNSGSDLDFTFSLYNSAGDTLITSMNYTDTTPSLQTGQVGMRFASETIWVESFSVVPEPSSGILAALGLAGVGLHWYLRKRRKV